MDYNYIYNNCYIRVDFSVSLKLLQKDTQLSYHYVQYNAKYASRQNINCWSNSCVMDATGY